MFWPILTEGFRLKTPALALHSLAALSSISQNVGHFISETYRILKTGGELIIITDNAGYLTFHLACSRQIGQVHRPGGYRGLISIDQHYALFTDAHLLNHLISVGFRPVCVRYVNVVEIGRLNHLPPLQRCQKIF